MPEAFLESFNFVICAIIIVGALYKIFHKK